MVDGITIYDKFIPLYKRLYGQRTTGKPLTGLRINYDLNRLEQFFENLGFAQSLDDPNGPVYLISYGAYFCESDSHCPYRLNEYWAIIKSDEVDQPYGTSVNRLGGTDVFGSPLTQPAVAADGFMEQVYKTVIFYSSADDPSRVRLRPLPIMLGYRVGPDVPKKSHELLVFYEGKPGSGLGHNVLRYFDWYVALHGGPELAGKPISEVIQLKDQQRYRQCFENYCLLYDPALEKSVRVSMLPLGDEFIQRFPPEKSSVIANMFSPDHIFLLAAPDKPIVNTGDPQTIRLIVLQKDNGQPLERVEGTLVLTLPDQTTKSFYFQPTGSDGLSVINLPAMSGVEHGDRLKFQVCLNLPSDAPICYGSSYLVWNTK